MKLNFVIGILMSTLIFTACSNHQSQQQVKNNTEKASTIQLTDSLKSILVQRGDNIAKHAQAAFQIALKKAIESGGMEYAIGFCNIEAMQITDSVSGAQNVQIRRLAKNYRNPLNKTDETESKIFKSYLLEWLKGENLMAKIIPDKQGHPVYYRAIGIQPVCLNCHGVPGVNIPSPLSEKIAALYPEDKAINFKKGDLRGMWAIKFEEYRVE